MNGERSVHQRKSAVRVVTRCVAVIVSAFVLFGLAGCGDPYRDVLNQQTANYKEIASILRDITDGPSLDAAEGKLMARTQHFREVSRRANALPKPPDDDATRERLQTHAVALKAAYNEMAAELRRVQKVPGGAEFFERFSEMTGGSVRGKAR